MNRAPGTYINLLDDSAYASSPASASAAVVGVANWGPSVPITLGSYQAYVEKFGEADDTLPATLLARNYFNYGNELTMVRVAALDDTGSRDYLKYATVVVNDAAATPAEAHTIYAKYPGTRGNNLSVKYVATTGVLFNLEVYYSGTLVETHKNLTVADDATNSIETKIGSIVSLGLEGQTDEATNFTMTPGDSKWVVVKKTTTTLPALGGVAQTLTGGDSGIAPTDIEIIGDETIGTGMSALYDKETYNVDLFAVPGYTSSTVVDAMISLADARKTALPIIDAPADSNATATLSWHDAFDTWRGAAYWSWLGKGSNVENVVYIPPSTHVLPQFAYNDLVGFPWEAPAGNERGKLAGTLVGTQYSAKESVRAELYLENRINPIVAGKDGIVIYGQKTLYKDQDSVLSSINVARLVMYVMKQITIASEGVQWKQNYKKTWDMWVMDMNNRMEYIKTNGGVYWYGVQMDATTNTTEHVTNKEMVGIVAMSPTLAGEVISIGLRLTPYGVNVFLA